MRVVVDTSVLVNVALESSSFHEEGMRLHAFIKENKIEIMMPMHGMFEVACAMAHSKLSGNLIIDKSLNEENGWVFIPVPIDESFFKKYFSPELPYIRAGDFIFMAYAKGENIPLITRDQKLSAKAKEAGGEVYEPIEFIEQFS